MKRVALIAVAVPAFTLYLGFTVHQPPTAEMRRLQAHRHQHRRLDMPRAIHRAALSNAIFHPMTRAMRWRQVAFALIVILGLWVIDFVFVTPWFMVGVGRLLSKVRPLAAMGRFIEANWPAIALVVLLVLLAGFLIFAFRGNTPRRVALVTVSLVLGLGVAVGAYQATAPTYCPKSAGLIGPAEKVCVQPDFLTNRYGYPPGHPFRDLDGNLVDVVKVGTDIGGSSAPASFWYPLIWIGTSALAGLLIIGWQRSRVRQTET